MEVGLRLIKSIFEFSPRELVDLFKWRSIKWNMDIIKIIIGRKKWIEKNRLIRVILILKFPQIQFINKYPKLGIEDKKLVITIIAQYDIWFQINE